MDVDLNDPMATDGGEALTYNRMEAKPIAGEHCRFCGRERVPLVKTRCCEQWICCDTAFMSFRGGGYCQFEHENESACHFHYNEGHQGSLQDLRSVGGFLEKTRSNDAGRGREMSRY